MIHIENIDDYLRHPGLNKNLYRQQLPENMVYRAMIYLTKTFTTEEIQLILRKLWGIELSKQQITVGIRRLREAGYLYPNGKKSPYYYKKTPLYIRDLQVKLMERGMENND